MAVSGKYCSRSAEIWFLLETREKKRSEKKITTGSRPPFDLDFDFIDCGNQPERAFPFPLPTCLAASLCLESCVWFVRRVSPRKVSTYEAHATCFLGPGNRWRVLLLHHLAFQRKPSRG